jgi:poly(3-hydroxybutyrate) depolymerase
MRGGLIFILMMANPSFAQSPPARLGPGDYSLSLVVRGLERNYLVHVPSLGDGKSPMPVVIMLHGGGGTAEITRSSTGWIPKADEGGFIIAFPEATRRDPSQAPSFLFNPQIWNDGSGRGFAGRENVDDIGFLNAMMDDIIARFGDFDTDGWFLFPDESDADIIAGASAHASIDPFANNASFPGGNISVSVKNSGAAPVTAKSFALI